MFGCVVKRSDRGKNFIYPKFLCFDGEVKYKNIRCPLETTRATYNAPMK